MIKRSLWLFKNSIKSSETLEKYLYHLKRFKIHCGLKDFDEIITLDGDQLQSLLEDYVVKLKNKGLAKSSVAGPLNAIKLFLEINDIDLRWKKIRRLLPKENKKTGQFAWTTKQIQIMLSFTTDLRTKSLILFLSSSGVRVGAIPEIKIKHLKEIDYNCKSIQVYANDKEEYFTFLTPESCSILDNYLQKRKNDGEKLNLESPVFRQTYQLGSEPVKTLRKASISSVIYRVLYRSGIRYDKDGKRKDVQVDHGFRKRFNTILKTTPELNSNLAEKMMGHSTSIPLDNVYLDASIDLLFQEFKKAIPDLTIDGLARKQAELKKIQAKNFDFEVINQRVFKLEDQMTQIIKKISTLESWL